MFLSNYSGNAVPYTDLAMFNDISPNSKQDPSSSFFQFSPTYIDNEDTFFPHHQDQLFVAHLQQQQQLLPVDTSSETLPVNAIGTMIPRKRSAKKDRHSKIVTAQGPRDRRMRLSLQIARRFFNLQDMLGFDKASKTVEWLLTKSKAAIKELGREPSQTKHSSSGGAKSVSSTSECEVVSGIDETAYNEYHQQGIISSGKSLEAIPKEKKIRQSRKATFHPLARESRAEARARARERTMKKMWSRRLDKSKQCPQKSPHNLNQLMRSSSSLDTGDESGSHSHDMKSSLEGVVEIEERSSHSPDEHHGPMENISEDSFVITRKLNPSPIFNYHHDVAILQGVSSNNNNNVPNFPENWDIDNARTHSSYCVMTNMHPSRGNVQERIPSSICVTTPDIRFPSQFADSHFYGKPWEPCNNPSLY